VLQQAALTAQSSGRAAALADHRPLGSLRSSLLGYEQKVHVSMLSSVKNVTMSSIARVHKYSTFQCAMPSSVIQEAASTFRWLKRARTKPQLCHLVKVFAGMPKYRIINQLTQTRRV
jgi:hypothetical protein